MALIKQVMKGPNEILPFDHPTIRYPQLASTKFDGFRCLCLCGERFLSPNLKDIRNKNLAGFLAELGNLCNKNHLVVDGELWSPKRSFHEEIKANGISSILTTFDLNIPNDIGYYVFDMMCEEDWDGGTVELFFTRYTTYSQILHNIPHVIPVLQYPVHSPQEAEAFFNNQLDLEQEGMILRQPNAKYKHGRCTTNQDGMWKFKEFITHDAMIVGVEEQMKLKPGVERTRNEIGHLERRFEQDLYEPAGMVGAFVVQQDPQDGQAHQFKVKPGKGQNAYLKTSWWQDYKQHPEKWHGKHIEYRYMPHGTKDKPRIGSLVRFRPDKD
jgi:DNA ligase-1